MNKIGLRLLIGLLTGGAAAWLHGEVVVAVDMPRRNFICYEAIPVTVTLRNNSGQALICGGEAELRGEIGIDLTDTKGKPLPGDGTRIPIKGLILRPGVDNRIRIDITRPCKLVKPGFYRAAIVFKHPLLTEEYTSKPFDFNISTGHVFWKRRLGIPNFEENNAEPVKLRSFSIMGVEDRYHLYFYLVIEDEKLIYALRPIGEALGRERFDCQVDMLTRLHIMIPLSAQVYHYQIFDWEGAREKSAFYRIADAVPTLFRNPQTGEVTVIGGEPATPGMDYIEEKLLPEELDDIPLSAPVAGSIGSAATTARVPVHPGAPAPVLPGAVAPVAPVAPTVPAPVLPTAPGTLPSVRLEPVK